MATLAFIMPRDGALSATHAPRSPYRVRSRAMAAAQRYELASGLISSLGDAVPRVGGSYRHLRLQQTSRRLPGVSTRAGRQHNQGRLANLRGCLRGRGGARGHRGAKGGYPSPAMQGWRQEL